MSGHGLRLIVCGAGCLAAGLLRGVDEPHRGPEPVVTAADSGAAAPRRLILACSSLRERPAFAGLYLYRHDGASRGELLGAIPVQFERADTHPSLSAGGEICAYAAKQVGGFTPLVNLWQRRESRALPPPAFNTQDGARIEPVLSADGQWLACCARGQAGAAGGWDVLLWSLHAAEFVPLPGLNTEADEREVTVDGTARHVCCVTQRRDGAGLSDLLLYDRTTGRVAPLAGVNTSHRELNPALSADGRYLAFVSDRPEGAGGKDVYLYDLTAQKLVELPGLNSVAHEQTPALSPDGRYVAFVSERTRGAGERDVYLYDRALSRLLPTPGLNSPAEDFDPALTYEQLEPADPMK